jgi:hypothetical protein
MGSAQQTAPAERRAAERFVELMGRTAWDARLAGLRRQAAVGPRMGRALLQRHLIECTIDRLRQPETKTPDAKIGTRERRVAALCQDAVALAKVLDADGRQRFRTALRASLAEGATLVPLFHLLNTASRQRSRGFDVTFAGYAQAAPYDLLLSRHGEEAELSCEVMSAEAGRDVHRGAWFRLVDRIDPELQTWLAAHPGRYLLKITLPNGLRETDDATLLSELHTRITGLLSERRRSDQDEAAVLRLDPLMLAAAQADELGLLSRLRQDFGPEAHLAVTTAGEGLFVLAARAGRENEVAAAVRRHLAEIAPHRLTGARPGILAVFVEDTDRTEWRGLRERLELEGAARQFLTQPHARGVVAVTCTTRLELFEAPDAADDGELRFRNPAHPAAKRPALAPAVLSTL